jgi:hypothetical protein
MSSFLLGAAKGHVHAGDDQSIFLPIVHVEDR